MRKRTGNREIAIREFRWYALSASRSRYRAPSRRDLHTKAHKIRRYCIWRGTEGGEGGEGAIEVSILFSSARLCQESMHLKFFFSANYNITIMSDLVGSTYLVTGYKLESEVHLDNWQWGCHRYFRKEKEKRRARGEKERTRANYFQNKSIYTHTLTNIIIIIIRARWKIMHNHNKKKRGTKRRLEEDNSRWWRCKNGQIHILVWHRAILTRLFVPLPLLQNIGHIIRSHSLWRKSNMNCRS